MPGLSRGEGGHPVPLSDALPAAAGLSRGGGSPVVRDGDVEAHEDVVGPGERHWFVDRDVTEGGEDRVQEVSDGVGGSHEVLGKAKFPEAFEESG